MNYLPPYYLVYGYSAYQVEICEILNQTGYMHISTTQENKVKLFEFNDVFVIANMTTPYPLQHYSPRNVYAILDIPERHVTYSQKELQNLVDMLYADLPTAKLALNLFSKMNVGYIRQYKENIRECFLNNVTHKHMNEDPYLAMLKDYSIYEATY